MRRGHVSLGRFAMRGLGFKLEGPLRALEDGRRRRHVARIALASEYAKPALVALTVVAMSAALGTGLVDFFEGEPSVPGLITSFFPFAIAAGLPIALIAVKRSEGTLLPPLTRPPGSWRGIAFAVLAGAMIAVLMAWMAIVLIGLWGTMVTVLLVASFSGLIAMFWLSVSGNIVAALATYFAIWPLLNIGRTVINFGSTDVHQSLLVIPVRLTAEPFHETSSLITSSVWGQLLLLSPEAGFVFVIGFGTMISGHGARLIRVLTTPVGVSVGVLLGAALISAILSEERWFSLVFFVGGFGAPALMFLLVASSVDDQKRISMLLWGMVVGLGIFVAYDSLITYRTLIAGTPTRFGALGNPNFGGTILILLIPTALDCFAVL